MYPDFIVQAKSTIFWLNRGVRVYFDLYVPNCPKMTYFLLKLHFFLPLKVMLSNYLVLNNYLKVLFGNQAYTTQNIPLTIYGAKHGAFYLNNNVSVNILVLLVLLS